MKKLLFLAVMCLVALAMQAQRCAVLEFKAGVGISQDDVEGLSAIFITYFRPAGYTMVERTQIDRAIEEQGLQRSRMTESQMVRIGEILNVSKIVVGDVNIVMEQYNVDTRVINVETGTIVATEGATFTSSSFRSSMQGMAQKLASQIAIAPGGTVSAVPSQPTTRNRSKVEVLYGYLKIFPNEIGSFQSEPTSVIAQINSQVQHGYNNWRIPTNEELSLLRANNYLGSGEYMTRESKRGIVLLVTDGDDYETVRKKAEEIDELKSQGYVDLGLKSGTWWRIYNEDNDEGGFYTYDQAINNFGDKLPTKEQFEELESDCQWTWDGSGYKVTGPNGNSIVLPAWECHICIVNTFYSGTFGRYWSSTSFGSDNAVALYFNSQKVIVDDAPRRCGYPVRLVHD